jgi:hypothetical protein
VGCSDLPDQRQLRCAAGPLKGFDQHGACRSRPSSPAPRQHYDLCNAVLARTQARSVTGSKRSAAPTRTCGIVFAAHAWYTNDRETLRNAATSATVHSGSAPASRGTGACRSRGLLIGEIDAGINPGDHRVRAEKAWSGAGPPRRPNSRKREQAERQEIMSIARPPESSRTNADDRLPRAPLGRVEGDDSLVEGRDVADVRLQSSVPHPLDDLT